MPETQFYFEEFEERRPPAPLEYSAPIEQAYRFCAVVAIILGGWYIWWRWSASLNFDALWFAVPLVVAETMAYIGLLLFAYNLWYFEDPEVPEMPQTINDCIRIPQRVDRPICVDVFYPTYNEDPELVRLSIQDGKNIRYPHPIDIRIHVLDDGKRPAMQDIAAAEGVGYITRASNIGYKAGNMRNAMERTSGDFILICDADTRVYPDILEEMLPYFRDPDMAWSQSPQWFYDIPAGEPLPQWIRRKTGRIVGGVAGLLCTGVEKIVGPIRIGADPFSNDPQMFYDIILRRRNKHNAAFCCGAGSLHRREAVMEVALKNYVNQVQAESVKLEKAVLKATQEAGLDATLADAMKQQTMRSVELTPYKFHVSEDIYTSIKLHADPTRNWKSVQHPKILSKMLSPQDLGTWMVQRFKYAGGTLDIFKSDNPLREKGLTLAQKLLYSSTYWSYLGALSNLVFLLAPIIFLFSGIAPISAYSNELFARLLPFIIFNELAFMFGTMGLSCFGAKSSYIAFFYVNLKAIWAVLRGQEITFKITSKTRDDSTFAHLVVPQMVLLGATLAGIVLANALYWVGGSDRYDLAGIIFNTLWGTFNISFLYGMIASAFWKPPEAASPV